MKSQVAWDSCSGITVFAMYKVFVRRDVEENRRCGTEHECATTFQLLLIVQKLSFLTCSLENDL